MAAAWRVWAWARAWFGRRGFGPGGALVPVILVGVIVVGQLLAPMRAGAEEKREFKYPYAWVYKAVYRLLKIDLKCAIDEADQENGFIMFQYEYEGAKTPASIEMVDLTNDEDGYAVAVRVDMEKLPSWVEVDLMDQVGAKMEDQFGDPPPFKKKQDPKPKEDPEPAPDEGEGEGEGQGPGK